MQPGFEFSRPTFDGATFDAKQDWPRLMSQLDLVRSALRPGDWYTLRDLVRIAGGSEASVSARVRDLRKLKFGAHRIERRRRRPGAGTWEYRMVTEGSDHGDDR